MLCVDLLALESGALDAWPLFSSRHTASLMALLPRDHLGASAGGASLQDRVLDTVEARTGRRPRGAVRLLTCPRVLGLEFNPVSFFYVMDEAGVDVEVFVAEVNNIPWFEQHLYVLEPDGRGCAADGERDGKSGAKKWEVEGAKCDGLQLERFRGHQKAFHVSPFMPIKGISYDWLVSPPSDRLAVRIGLSEDGDSFFSASIDMRRRPWSFFGLLSVFLRYPFLALYVVLGIMYEAGKLWRRGFIFYPHPDGAETASSKAIASVVGALIEWKATIQSLCGASGDGDSVRGKDMGELSDRLNHSTVSKPKES